MFQGAAGDLRGQGRRDKGVVNQEAVPASRVPVRGVLGVAVDEPQRAGPVGMLHRTHKGILALVEVAARLVETDPARVEVARNDHRLVTTRVGEGDQGVEHSVLVDILELVAVGHIDAAEQQGRFALDPDAQPALRGHPVKADGEGRQRPARGDEESIRLPGFPVLHRTQAIGQPKVCQVRANRRTAIGGAELAEDAEVGSPRGQALRDGWRTIRTALLDVPGDKAEG